MAKAKKPAAKKPAAKKKPDQAFSEHDEFYSGNEQVANNTIHSKDGKTVPCAKNEKE